MRFVAGDASNASLKWGAVLEFGLIVTQIGTAVVIYPLVRRQSETVSLGYVAARIMESVFAAIGLISIITVVSLADELVGANWCRSHGARRPGRHTGADLRLGVPVGTRTRRRHRERHHAGLPDVQVGARPASHGAAGAHRRVLVGPSQPARRRASPAGMPVPSGRARQRARSVRGNAPRAPFTGRRSGSAGRRPEDERRPTGRTSSSEELAAGERRGRHRYGQWRQSLAQQWPRRTCSAAVITKRPVSGSR